jgi:hypothetical protein
MKPQTAVGNWIVKESMSTYFKVDSIEVSGNYIYLKGIRLVKVANTLSFTDFNISGLILSKEMFKGFSLLKTKKQKEDFVKSLKVYLDKVLTI